MAELRIPIIGEFKGKKAFDDAGKATSKLDKGVKKLGVALIAALSVQKITQFGKNAVKAFAENEKSAKRLETVVKNLGLAFETPGIEASLDKISAKFGYEGEVLREAFQKLITTTGSAKKSQDLLNLSLDIAAGSGVDLLTVNQDLAAAYTGQTRGLRKYNLGLTQSELKTLDFDSAVTKLTANFKGAGGAELETYAGQMRILQEGADNAQEIIGGGLVDALMILSGDTSVEDLAVSMETFATNTSTAIGEIAKLGKTIANFFSQSYGSIDNFSDDITDFIDRITFNADRITRRNVGRSGRFFGGGSGGAGGNIADNIARRNAEAAAIKRAKELAALQKKALDAQKKALAASKKQNDLLKASQTLDLERISIAAALKGQISETDRLSLSLQLALLNQNDEAATKLSGLLTSAVKRQNELNALLLATPEAPNPYRNWVMPSFTGTAAAGNNLTTAGGALSLEDLRGRSGALVVPPTEMPSTVPNPYTTAGGSLSLEDVRGRSGAFTTVPNVTVVVELDGKVVSDAIRDETLNKTLSGTVNAINRSNRFVRPDEG